MMFNAYATPFMCGQGFEILDIHPLAASFPAGTGGRGFFYWQEHDIVHFRKVATKPFEDALVEYFLGNLPEELTLENYQFS